MGLSERGVQEHSGYLYFQVLIFISQKIDVFKTQDMSRLAIF